MIVEVIDLEDEEISMGDVQEDSLMEDKDEEQSYKSAQENMSASQPMEEDTLKEKTLQENFLKETTMEKPQHNVEENELGGTIDTPAFALLVGKDGSNQSCQIPISKLPVIFGRTHFTNDPKFIPLGKYKNISRYHFTIYYRDARGDKLQTNINDETKDMDYTYETPPEGSKPMDITKDKNGFFAIECLGKNKINVSGQKIAQGQVAVLEDGATIQLSTHSLYFLLPQFSEEEEYTPETIQISNPKYTPPSTSPTMEKDTSSLRTPSHKKLKLDTYADLPNSLSLLKSPQTPKICAEFDVLPVNELLSLMTEAIHSNQWSKRDSILGSVISFHAAREAGASSSLQNLAAQSDSLSVSRSDVMKWIDDSDKYGTWASQMLSRIEVKSYQSNIGKSLIRAGYKRSGNIGRHSKWCLPEDLAPKEKLESLRDLLQNGGVAKDDEKVEEKEEEEGEPIENIGEEEEEKIGHEEDEQEQEDEDDDLNVLTI